MGDHIQKKRDRTKHHKRGFNESQDIMVKRQTRVSFKNYMNELEEELLEQELLADDSIVEELETDNDADQNTAE